MKLNVMNEAGGTGSEIEVADAVFAAKFNEPLVHQVVVAYQANGRQGTRKQKTRAEVRGGGRKPYAQKGTGQARAGTIRSPLWRKGGRVFPSSPDENFTHKVNRKMYRSALRSILSELVREERLVPVVEFAIDGPKTKSLVARLDKLGARDALIVVAEVGRALGLAARNLPNIDVCAAAAADPVSLLAYDKIVVTAGALKRFEELLA